MLTYDTVYISKYSTHIFYWKKCVKINNGRGDDHTESAEMTQQVIILQLHTNLNPNPDPDPKPSL